MTAKQSLIKQERFMKWEKVKVEAAMDQVILAQAIPLANTLIDIALNDRNPNAINSLLDRAFGKASQNVNLGGQVDNPIVFLPSELMVKYAIKAGKYTELNKEENQDPAGMLVEPLDASLGPADFLG